MKEFENIDFLIKILKEKLSKERVQVINPIRVAEVQSAFAILSKIALSVDPKAKLKCGSDELNDGSLSIDIEANEIIVYNKDLKAFIEGIGNASNFEIYPLKNGKIRMSIMFYGCLKEL